MYGFGNSTLWAVAVGNVDFRWAVKALLAGSLDQRAKVPWGFSWFWMEARPSDV